MTYLFCMLRQEMEILLNRLMPLHFNFRRIVIKQILFLLSFSAWQSRRVVLTKEFICFAFVNHDEEIDRIPLAGIDYVKSNDDLGATMEAEMESSHEHFCLQVATDPEGHNSGRSYYMRTNQKDTYDDFFPALKKYAKIAKKRAQASTVFQRAQHKVRKVYTHFICQSIFALIIIGVSAAPWLQVSLDLVFSS